MKTRLAQWIASLVLFAALSGGIPAPVAAQPAEALFRDSLDEKVIASQVHMAVPAYRRGHQMLTAATDQTETAAAIRVLFESYRFLRAAQQGSEMVRAHVKFPDPLIQLRIDRLWQIRVRLLKCIDTVERLNDPGDPARAECLAGLPDGYRQLQVLSAMLP
jgi:hypothetical protein